MSLLTVSNINFNQLQEARRLAIVREAKIALAARRIQAEWRMHVEYKKFWIIKNATDLIRVKFFIRCILRLRYLKLVSTRKYLPNPFRCSRNINVAWIKNAKTCFENTVFVKQLLFVHVCLPPSLKSVLLIVE